MKHLKRHVTSPHESPVRGWRNVTARRTSAAAAATRASHTNTSFLPQQEEASCAVDVAVAAALAFHPLSGEASCGINVAAAAT